MPYYNPIFPDSRVYLCSPNPHPLLPPHRPAYNLEQADTRAAQQPSPARRGSRSSQRQSQQESASAAEPLDFVLCIGDDSSDELMFQALQDALGTSTSHSDLFTCTVGRACLHP